MWFDHFTLFCDYVMVFQGVGMIGTVFDTFWSVLCDIVIFGGFEIVDFSQHILIRVTDSKTNYASKFGISTLGW